MPNLIVVSAVVATLFMCVRVIFVSILISVFFFLRSRLDAHARRTHMHTRNFAVRGVYLCAVTSQMTKELR